MEATKGNGLDAANDQPAKTQTSNATDFIATTATSAMLGEQLSFLPTPEFCPILPPHGSAAEQALNDLIERDLTTPDWIDEGKGWRLAAAVKELGYLGWEPKSIMVLCNRWGRKIARYSLSAKAKQAFYSMRETAHA